MKTTLSKWGEAGRRSSLVRNWSADNYYAAGLVPFLYVCDSLLGGLFAAAAIGAVFGAAMATVWLLRPLLHERAHENAPAAGGDERGRYLAFAVIAAAWAGVAALALEAWWYPLRRELGWYLLIAPLNATLLCCLRDCALRDAGRRQAVGFVPAACLFALAGMMVGGAREWLGQGDVQWSVAAYWSAAGGGCAPECAVGGSALFGHSAGGLLVAGVLLAGANGLVGLVRGGGDDGNGGR